MKVLLLRSRVFVVVLALVSASATAAVTAQCLTWALSSLVRHMRAQGITFPIVAITARADPGAIDSAHAAGCDRLMRKPVSGQMLAALMADCIALNESDRELAEHSAV